MKKSKILGAAIYVIILALFNALFFGLGGAERPASVWIAYGFIHFALVMMIITPFITQKGTDRATYAASMETITLVYLIIAVIVGVIFILLSLEGYKLSLFLQLVLAAIYLIILFSNMIADSHTAQAVEKHEAELVYVKESCSRLKAVLNEVSDKQLHRQVEQAFDLIQSSPVKSNHTVYGIEREVMEEIENLSSAVHSGNGAAVSSSADKIVKLASERNRLLRLSN